MMFPVPRKIEEEEKRLMDAFFSTEDDEDWDEFARRNASKEYLEFIEKKNQEEKELLKQGILV